MPTRKNENFEEPAIETITEPVSYSRAGNSTRSKRKQLYSVLPILTFVAGLFIGYIMWGFNSVEQSTEPKFVRRAIPSEGFPSTGPKDAPITIVEFSDYQCPFCRKWHQEVYQPLMAAYPGKIRMVYRNLPLTSIHPEAFAAAEAAMCAGDQNAYWEYHEKLFSSDRLGTDIYTQYALDLRLNMNEFQTCLSENKYKAAIEADSDFALGLGVSSTPTFFINGLAVVGAQPLSVFQQVIDEELAGETPE